MRLHRVVVVALGVAALHGGSALADQHKPINESKVWQQRWSKASPAERSWAHSTSSCETGGTNDPTTNTGNGYLSAFQYDERTWWAAPDTGRKRGEAHRLPHLEPWTVQAVVSIKKVRADRSTAAWPNCG